MSTSVSTSIATAILSICACPKNEEAKKKGEKPTFHFFEKIWPKTRASLHRRHRLLPACKTRRGVGDQTTASRLSLFIAFASQRRHPRSRSKLRLLAHARGQGGAGADKFERWCESAIGRSTTSMNDGWLALKGKKETNKFESKGGPKEETSVRQEGSYPPGTPKSDARGVRSGSRLSAVTHLGDGSTSEQETLAVCIDCRCAQP